MFKFSYIKFGVLLLSMMMTFQMNKVNEKVTIFKHNPNLTHAMNYSNRNRWNRLPPSGMSMLDIRIFINLLKRNIPFGFSHFNDNEIRLIDDCPEGTITDAGWQNCSRALSEAMLQALTNTAPNFYIGIPCICEFGGQPFLRALEYLNITYDQNIVLADGQNNVTNPALNALPCPTDPVNYQLHFPPQGSNPVSITKRLTVAPVFMNGNNVLSKEALPRIFHRLTKQGHGIHIVTGDGHKTKNLLWPIASVYSAARTHAFEANYKYMRRIEFLHERYKPGDVILLMVGPLGRILASEWSVIEPAMTYLDLGSLWDDEMWSRNYWYSIMKRPCMHKKDIKLDNMGL